MPAERLMTERELLVPLPSLRASIGKFVTRKVDRLSCVRFTSARYSVPTRLIGSQVQLRTDDARLAVIMAATGEVVAEHTLVAPGEVRDRSAVMTPPRRSLWHPTLLPGRSGSSSPSCARSPPSC